MKIFPILRDLYGQLRGYGRWSIRREVARNMQITTDALWRKSEALRESRYLFAIEHFPAYASLVASRTGMSDLSTIPFEQLPILTKSDITTIISKQSSFPPLPSVQKQIRHATGGSTGQPFSFFITRESYEWRSAVSDRGYGWAQAEEGQRSFYVWGTSIHKPGAKQRLKQGIHHWLQNRRYFDSFHFDDAQKAECCRQINKFKPDSLVGYTGNLIELARYVSRNPGVLTWKARTAVTAAEGLRPGMRELIEANLANEVFMSYGSREFMLIGMEGPDHDGYRIASDNLYVEVVDEAGRPRQPGELGRIVITDLHNEATPFVRYAIGDLGKVESRKSKVEIESRIAVDKNIALVEKNNLSTFDFRLSPFPKLATVDGRLQELIVRADGEKLTALFIPHLMKDFDWVDGYQVVQEAPGRITVNLVTDDPAWDQKTSDIRTILVEKLGRDMVIGFERVAVLVKNASGKTPIVLKTAHEGQSDA